MCTGKSFDAQRGVRTGQSDTKPNKREKRVGEPVQPSQILLSLDIVKEKVQPDVKEFIRAETRNEIRLELAGAQILLRNIIAALEWGDTPSERPFG